MKIQTLCLAKSELEAQGVTTDKHGILPFNLSEVNPHAFSYISRSVVDVETFGSHEADVALNNPQILAYILVHSEKGLLRYTRKHSPDESRLLGSYSIGFGGHSDVGDIATKHVGGETVFDVIQTIKTNIARELEEELTISKAWLRSNPRLKHADFMISDPRPNLKEPKKIAVGQAHRAIIFTLDLTGLTDLAKPTTEAQELTWINEDEAITDLEMYESWSQLLLTDFIITGDLK